MIKGVPIELQTAYNQQPENYLLLGLMADAADEQEELEVGEALRWLWRWQRVPKDPMRQGDFGWGLWFDDTEGEESSDIPLPLLGCSPPYTVGDTALRCIERITIGFPQWKAQHSEEYHRLSVPPSISTPKTTPS